MNHQRIIIIGDPGSGKSTLSRQMAKQLAIPHICVDDYFWNRDGTSIAQSELIQAIEKVIAQKNSWIIEGHFKTLHPSLLPHATSIIEIESSFLKSGSALLKREWSEITPLRQRISKLFFFALNYRKLKCERKEIIKNHLHLWRSHRND